MSELVALMYHAIYADEKELQIIPEEDRPYAISTEQFEEHLTLMEEKKIPILAPDVIHQQPVPSKGVILTFDDGDQSFYKHAHRILKARGYKGLFFITTDLIDSREDFCDWPELKEMAEMGMEIQCHGQTHRFFDDLSAEESKSEFETAKNALELNTGQKVYAISFPGGRFKQRDLEIGRSLGYTAFYTSEIGALTGKQVEGMSPLPRLAIRQNTNINTFLLMANGDKSYIRKEAFKNFVKMMIKKLLGNHLYHNLYKAVTS